MKERDNSVITLGACSRVMAPVRECLVRWLTDHGVRQIFYSPIFWSVLAIKLVLGTLLASHYLRDIFTPFLNYFVESHFANPWDYFSSLTRLTSFPYPPIMLYLMAIPRCLFDPLLASGTETVTSGHLLVMRLPMVAADVGIALILARWFPHRVRRVLLYYWCSPFTIYICYWHGQLDIIPTVLFLCCLHLLQTKRYTRALVMYSVALATKSHLLVALPFLLVYVYQERRWRGVLRCSLAALTVYTVSVFPYATSPAFWRMVYGSEEQGRLVAFQLPFGVPALAVLMAPGAIVLLWFRFAAYTKRNWDLVMLYMGILFSVFILLAPPRPGYFLWSLPFLIHFMCRSSKANALPYWVYAASYLAFFSLGDQSDLLDAWRVIAPGMATHQTPFQFMHATDPELAIIIQNVVFTVMQASLAGLVLNMYLLGVRSNAVYRSRTQPVLIGVTGDSGTGKDTFSRLAINALGQKKVSVLAGDDYHRWPRGHEMWQVYTHLNVNGSDVHQQHEHAVAISSGASIYKGTYDHTTGQFSEPQLVDPAEIVIFQGLHSLSIEGLRNLYDLKVFLDPDENLRQFWKIRRDQRERGYSVDAIRQTIADREKDRVKYILPQREESDLVIRWMPKTPLDPLVVTIPSELSVEILARNTFDLSALAKHLANQPALSITHQPMLDVRWQSLCIDGTIPAESIQAIAKEVVVNIEEIAGAPTFDSDLPGCVQITFLVCLSNKLRWTGSGLV